VNDSDYRRDPDKALSQSRPTTWPLSRRTVASLLGLVSSLGLTGVSRVAASQQDERQATPEAAAGTLGLGIIGLHVDDLGSSLDFYRCIGLDIPTDIDLSSGAFRLPLPTGQIFYWETIAYTRQYFQDYERGTGQRKVALEFGFRTPAEVDEMYNALIAEGYGSYKEPLSWGSIRFAGVVDPDDNQIALRFPLVS
jgi:predicted lactoylglutathione lyase